MASLTKGWRHYANLDVFELFITEVVGVQKLSLF